MKTITTHEWEPGDIAKVKDGDEVLYGTVKHIQDAKTIVITVIKPVPGKYVGLQDLAVAPEALRQPKYMDPNRDVLLRILTGNHGPKPKPKKLDINKILKTATEAKFKPPEDTEVA